ncbi:hypothetical protein ES319_A09G241600v1 [Gossypium barbadense]|uniref:Zinc knuckle CX2CX4HX4C domain-containing protein n=2 Tax=Gossypium TaxID=3633 RepID=A0A5J5UII9_GOSBA|nr:hypothetical protein ES319_A09G241600v1 [Gossypium barbadense]TYH04030.1 hypothetical protein ES288_A09G267200v1 [Gossypium darwinii]
MITWIASPRVPHGLVATRIGQIAGRALHVDGNGGYPHNVHFLGVRVDINPWKPLIAGCYIQSDDGIRFWVHFGYERVCKVCIQCGTIGHSRNNSPHDN